MEDIKNLIDSFFNDITIESIQFLTWTSPIVAALLALTTIVFSQYNERLLNTSNTINKEIKNLYILEPIRFELITEKLNDMIFILKGKSLYTFNLYFFAGISFLSFFAWLVAGIGYFIDNNNGLGNSIVIFIGLSVITITFLILPIILIFFNKKPLLTLDINNRLPFRKLSKYIKSISTTTDVVLIKSIVQPYCEITLSRTNKLNLNFKQELPIYGAVFIFEFVGEDFKKQLIKITNTTVEKYLTFEINSLEKTANNFEGLFTLISQSMTQNLYVFSSDKKELLATYKLKINLDNEMNLFSLIIKEEYRLTSNEKVDFILNSHTNFHNLDNKKLTEYKMKYKK